MARDNKAAIAAAVARRQVVWQWNGAKIEKLVNKSIQDRLRVACEYLKGKVVKNISVPVVKGIGKRSGRSIVTERSKPGEFPRADTTQLMKTIFSEVREISPEIYEGYVGTPLDYGLFLEILMERQYLTRTLSEERHMLEQIIGAGIVIT